MGPLQEGQVLHRLDHTDSNSDANEIVHAYEYSHSDADVHTYIHTNANRDRDRDPDSNRNVVVRSQDANRDRLG